MEYNKIKELNKTVKPVLNSAPVRIVFAIGGVAITLILISGAFKVLSVFFKSYNEMKASYKGQL